MVRVEIVPVLSDNYCYLIVDQKSNKAAAVDPVQVCTTRNLST